MFIIYRDNLGYICVTSASDFDFCQDIKTGKIYVYFDDGAEEYRINVENIIKIGKNGEDF